MKQPPPELDLLLDDVDFGTQRLADEWIGQKARTGRKWPNETKNPGLGNLKYYFKYGATDKA